MATSNQSKAKDFNTESLIKEAARKVFHNKGYAATRTRDIAAESGINLALLNYYFRSKQKLFEIIMEETMIRFLQSLIFVVNDEQTTLTEKFEKIAEGYIDLLIREPEIPVFIMSELRNGHIPHFFSKVSPKEILMNSYFARQWQSEVASGKYQDIPLIQMLMNLMGLCVFPFIGAPMLKFIGSMDEEQYTEAMLFRKKQIPVWLHNMLSPSDTLKKDSKN